MQLDRRKAEIHVLRRIMWRQKQNILKGDENKEDVT